MNKMLYYTSRVHEKQTIAPDFFFERQTEGILKRSTKKLRKPPTLFLFLTKIPTRLFVFNSDTVASVTPFPLFASFTPAHHYRSTHETDYLVRFYHTIPYHTVPYHTIPYHTVPYHTIPYHTIPYRTIPYHTIL